MKTKRAKKSLGQHFLTSRAHAKKIADAAAIAPNDAVLEIGPGKGMLTKELLARAEKVVAVEKDADLVPVLARAFAEEISRGTLAVVRGDILKQNPKELGFEAGKYIVAANIPYYISGRLVRFFLESETRPKRIVFLMQKEVAERIAAKDGKESVLSLSVKAYGDPTCKEIVPARYFSPKPKVDSAILLIDRVANKNFPDANARDLFFTIVKRGFSQKRKTILNNLRELLGERGEETLREAGIRATDRAENIPLENWLRLGGILRRNSQRGSHR